MLRFVIKKILRVMIVIFSVTLVMFLLLHAIPGSPLSNFASAQRVMQNMYYDESILREVNRRFGLDLPLWHQFTRYVVGDNIEGSFVCGLICGNLGPSISQRGRPIEDILFTAPPGNSAWKSQFGYSIRLVLFGSIIAIGLGVPLGILGARKVNSPLNRVISIILAAFISVPNFVLGLLAVIILASWLHVIKVLPDWDYFSNWIVPAFVLAIMPMGNIARVMQTSMINIQNEDYVRTARAKGLTERRVTFVHILRNALVPFITYLGPTLVELFAGLFIVESLYSFPGFGRQFWEAILKLDYSMILGLTILYAVGIAIINLIIEIISEFLDPRLHELKEQEIQ